MDDIPLCRPYIFCGKLSQQFLQKSGMPTEACPEQWMNENIHILQRLVKQNAAAGATYVTVPTFGANRIALSKYGLEQSCAEINRSLFLQVRNAAFPQTIIGAGLGPIPLEYDPDDGPQLENYIKIYLEQIEVLADCGVEYLYFCSMTSLEQMRAGMFAAQKFCLPVIMSIAANEDGKTCDGAEFLPCMLTLQKLGVSAFGLDGAALCEDTLEIFNNATQYSKVPFILLTDIEKDNASLITDLICAGVKYIGASCAENYRDCITLSEIFEHLGQEKEINKFEYRAAANECEAFFLLDDENLYFSEPVDCSFDLAEDLIDLDDENINVTVVEVVSMEEARILSQNANMSHLPIAIAPANEEILDYALLLFNGIAIVKSDCDIEYERLTEIAEKYGAIVI